MFFVSASHASRNVQQQRGEDEQERAGADEVVDD